MFAGVCTVRVPMPRRLKLAHGTGNARRVDRDLLVSAFDDGRATGKKHRNHTAQSDRRAPHSLAPEAWPPSMVAEYTDNN
jgi:hypothetical protein